MIKTLEGLQALVEYELEIENLLVKSRKREITDARCLFFRIAKDHLNTNVTKLASFSKQHHATVLYSLNKFEDMIRFDKQFERSWKSIITNKTLKKHEIMNTYNGWSNYPTWKINNDVLSNRTFSAPIDPEDLREAVEHTLFDMFEMKNGSHLVEDLARDFLELVNFIELSDAINADFK